ncbi:SDR family oxidoreductase [Tepidicella baoligensis]|uniref:SDR family NAD(P)-dependent oxidoreductase n=1 Tax=Tepidicella baoligensis TaxID=2707016 RepID=UPI0015DA96A2
MGPARRVAGRVGLITGGGAGIGAATAHLFCSEGASVCIVDTDASAVDRTLNAIRSTIHGSLVMGLVADVRDSDEAVKTVNQVIEKFGRLDILVNNAAMRNYSAADSATPEEWQNMVAVNLVGMSNYCKAALPALRASGQGSIVNVSSCYAVTGRKGMALYDATKAAQLAYTRTLAFEEAEHGVRANAICPGSTLTDFHLGRARQSGKDEKELLAERKNTSLIGRWASPIEIAYPILWMASSEASYITGTTLLVDGGLHIM